MMASTFIPDRPITLEEVQIIEMVHKTIREMLHDRGYIVKKFQEEQKSSTANAIFPHNWQLLIAEKTVNTSDDKIIIFFSSDHKLGVQEFRKYIEFIQNPPIHFATALQGVKHCIIVCKDGATSGVTNEMNLPEIRSIQVEIFSHKNLFRNPTQHKLYRKHTVCTAEEKQRILRRYNAKESEMPILLWRDPIRKYFHYPPGTLIRIERAISTGAPFVYYRIVSKPC